MTNHPIRGYRPLIARLQRLSATGKVDPQVRRLAVEAYQTMEAAEQYPRYILDADHYRNLMSYEDSASRVREENADTQAERADNMQRAKDAAERFLDAWNL